MDHSCFSFFVILGVHVRVSLPEEELSQCLFVGSESQRFFGAVITRDKAGK